MMERTMIHELRNDTFIYSRVMNGYVSQRTGRVIPEIEDACACGGLYNLDYDTYRGAHYRCPCCDHVYGEKDIELSMDYGLIVDPEPIKATIGDPIPATIEDPIPADIDPDEYRRMKALAQHLDIDPDEVYSNDDTYFEAKGEEWLVLTDEEADDACADYIKDNLWTFRSNFIAYWCDASEYTIQNLLALYEDGNDVLLDLLGDNLNDFIEDAIRGDGRGQFLSSYDGEEIEETVNGSTLYIYRLN